MDREVFDRKYTLRLNPQQAEAVHAVEGAVLLLAVPGSGKTTVLVTRLGYMLCCCGIPADKILTMTYTKAATREMRQRFARLFGEDCPQVPEFRTINGLCSRNPCDGIKIKPDTTFKHIEVYSPDEIACIIAHLDQPFGTAIAILLYTGIRSEEIMGLRWNDIDQKNRTITIRRVVTRVAKGEFAPVETTKSDRIRVITYGDQLAAHLRAAPRTSIYVVPAVRGGYMTPGSFRRQYDNFFKGLTVRRLSPHKLRHTYATYLIKGGAELRAVQTLLGHSSVKVTEIYTHVDTEDRRKATAQLAY